MKRLYHGGIYYFSWAVFGTVGLALNAACAVLLLLPGREARGPAVRAAIRRLFAAWVRWLHFTRMVEVVWHGPDPSGWPHPAVIVANHPSLIDATLLLGRLSETVCIFKPALRRNPFLAPAAIMAGYLSSAGGIDFIHQVAAELANGRSVLIFPEGTRTTPGTACNPLKPGFALIARRAGVPVQVLVVRADRELLPRGRAPWRLPEFPVRFDLYADRAVSAAENRSLDEIVRDVQDRFAEWLGAAP
ncbi:MAG TPA: lysophospholipid acyltransferase family protein [Opitutaceae bacterium]|jgi:1-acyl-sn-glycerol-3-phosphate acyltransferase|nr:lysophospholipid acyltransferase family protein [Opitutaceae bacterium]